MPQLNLYLTDDLQRDLKALMKELGITRRAEAIRIAVREMLAQRMRLKSSSAFKRLLGAGLEAPPNPDPRFKSDRDLW